MHGDPKKCLDLQGCNDVWRKKFLVSQGHKNAQQPKNLSTYEANDAWRDKVLASQGRTIWRCHGGLSCQEFLVW